jgi:plasmid stabilization system protein ParE
MTYHYLVPAKVELVSAQDHYEARQKGLGNEFINEIQRAIEHILQNPEASLRLAPGIRGCLTRRFPYGIIYTQQDDQIIIISVFNLKRHPASWRSNIP